MEVTVKDTPILGSAVFGTVDGLKANGNGILSHVGRSPGSILEFGEAREREKTLQNIPAGGTPVFRRRAQKGETEYVELLGVIYPCRDKSSRLGYYGAVVAVPADVLHPSIQIHDWDRPFDLADELAKTVGRLVSEDGTLSGLPAELVEQIEAANQSLPLRNASRGLLEFHYSKKLGADLAEVGDIFQAIAFGNPSTIFLYEGDLDHIPPVNHPKNMGLLSEMRVKVLQAQQQEEDRRHAAASRGRRSQQASPGAQRSHGTARRSDESYPSLERRVIELEHRMANLEARDRSRQPRKPQQQSNSGFLEQPETMPFESSRTPWTGQDYLVAGLIGATVVVILTILSFLGMAYLR